MCKSFFVSKIMEKGVLSTGVLWPTCFAFSLFFAGIPSFVGCMKDAKLGECEPYMIYCEGDVALICQDDAMSYRQVDCRDEDRFCHPGKGCVDCYPGTFTCEGTSVALCRADGLGADVLHDCSVESGDVCYLGSCINACQAAARERSYVGCEYWPVDLDNAALSTYENAAAQQFAVAVSNVGLISADVKVLQNDAPLGWPIQETIVDEILLEPDELHVFKLPSREVDGSHSGGYNNGTHSFLSSNAYRVVSNVPIVAYGFNPLENVQVFSNDASILFPQSALGNHYMVLGWPQTIADTDDPKTDFNLNLRAFLTVVGTEPGTDINITVSTDTVESTRIPAAQAGDTLSFTLGPYDVLNLETGSFNADFTGSEIISDKPIAVFSGNEASDVPFFDDLTHRRCCADHLEHQLFPVSAAGTEFVAARMPRRTPAVAAAGGDVTIIDEPEFFRILAIYDNTLVQLTLDPPNNIIMLDKGEHVTIEAHCDFEVSSSQPIFVGQFVASQQNIGIPIHSLPGGDPSFIILSPKEQWRSRYIFLTPDKYSFDFFVVIAPSGTEFLFDKGPMPIDCRVEPAECPGGVDTKTNMVVWRCQLSFPEIIPGLPPPDNVEPGNQNDGYHILEASAPVALIAYGFDERVSYAYIGGTNIKRINIE